MNNNEWRENDVKVTLSMTVFFFIKKRYKRDTRKKANERKRKREREREWKERVRVKKKKKRKRTCWENVDRLNLSCEILHWTSRRSWSEMAELGILGFSATQMRTSLLFSCFKLIVILVEVWWSPFNGVLWRWPLKSQYKLALGLEPKVSHVNVASRPAISTLVNCLIWTSVGFSIEFKRW